MTRKNRTRRRCRSRRAAFDVAASLRKLDSWLFEGHDRAQCRGCQGKRPIPHRDEVEAGLRLVCEDFDSCAEAYREALIAHCLQERQRDAEAVDMTPYELLAEARAAGEIVLVSGAELDFYRVAGHRCATWRAVYDARGVLAADNMPDDAWAQVEQFALNGKRVPEDPFERERLRGVLARRVAEGCSSLEDERALFTLLMRRRRILRPDAYQQAEQRKSGPAPSELRARYQEAAHRLLEGGFDWPDIAALLAVNKGQARKWPRPNYVPYVPLPGASSLGGKARNEKSLARSFPLHGDATSSQSAPVSTKPPENTCHDVERLLDAMGVERATKILGISRETLFRLCARRPVQRGTVALVSDRLGQLRMEAVRGIRPAPSFGELEARHSGAHDG